MTVRKEAPVQHGFSQEEIAEAVRATLLLLWGCEEPCPGTFESDVGVRSFLTVKGFPRAHRRTATGPKGPFSCTRRPGVGV
jgi:hypothetical protein